MARPSKKSDIIAAAAYLFSTKGYHATTVRDIAERSGILSGSLYAHIRNKEDLWREIVREAARSFTEALKPICDAPWPAAVKFDRAVHAHVRVIVTSMDRASIYLDADTVFSEEGRAEVRRLHHAYEELWGDLLEQGIQEGVFAIKDTQLARLWVLSSLNSLARWYRPQGRLSADEIADHFSDWALKAWAAS